METELGMLDLKGKDLHVNRLNLEKGEADIEGEIDMITYSKVPEVTGKKIKCLAGYSDKHLRRNNE